MEDDFLYEPIPGITEEKTKEKLEKLKTSRTLENSAELNSAPLANEGKLSLEFSQSLTVST